jgi:hypothetical protein
MIQALHKEMQAYVDVQPSLVGSLEVEDVEARQCDSHTDNSFTGTAQSLHKLRFSTEYPLDEDSDGAEHTDEDQTVGTEALYSHWFSPYVGLIRVVVVPTIVFIVHDLFPQVEGIHNPYEDCDGEQGDAYDHQAEACEHRSELTCIDAHSTHPGNSSSEQQRKDTVEHCWLLRFKEGLRDRGSLYALSVD